MKTALLGSILGLLFLAGAAPAGDCSCAKCPCFDCQCVDGNSCAPNCCKPQLYVAKANCPCQVQIQVPAPQPAPPAVIIQQVPAPVQPIYVAPDPVLDV